MSRSTVSLLERGEVVTTETLLQVLQVIGALHALGPFFEPDQPSPMNLLKEVKSTPKRVRKSRGPDFLEAEW